VGYISLRKGNTVPNHFISSFISHYPLTHSSLKDTTKFDKRVESNTVEIQKLEMIYNWACIPGPVIQQGAHDPTSQTLSLFIYKNGIILSLAEL